MRTPSESMTTPPISPGSRISDASGSSTSSSSTSDTDSSGTQAAGEDFVMVSTTQGHHRKFKKQGGAKPKAKAAARVAKPPPVSANRGAESARPRRAVQSVSARTTPAAAARPKRKATQPRVQRGAEAARPNSGAESAGPRPRAYQVIRVPVAVMGGPMRFVKRKVPITATSDVFPIPNETSVPVQNSGGQDRSTSSVINVPIPPIPPVSGTDSSSIGPGIVSGPSGALPPQSMDEITKPGGGDHYI